MMFNIEKLTLMTGIDIVIPIYGVKIHQPTISEIALMGEEKFFSCLNIFTIELNDLNNLLFQTSNETDNESVNILNNLNLYEVILLLINSNSHSKKIYQDFFSLIFCDYQFDIDESKFICILKNIHNETIEVDYNLFMIIRDVIKQIFILDKFFNTVDKYKPVNDKADEIARKLKKSKDKISAQNKTNENKSIFANIISILGVIGYNIQNLNSLTIYQLYNQFERYTLYMSYDQGVKAAMAGAKVDIVDWFKEI